MAAQKVPQPGTSLPKLTQAFQIYRDHRDTYLAFSSLIFTPKPASSDQVLSVLVFSSPVSALLGHDCPQTSL